jgi:hypothetical protein
MTFAVLGMVVAVDPQIIMAVPNVAMITVVVCQYKHSVVATTRVHAGAIATVMGGQTKLAVAVVDNIYGLVTIRQCLF